MKYYAINFKSVKEVDRKTFLKLDNAHLERDYITWYDDGENIFIGVCSLSPEDVTNHIFNTIGKCDSQYDMSY